MAPTGQILDVMGPYRVSGEHTVLDFVWFHVDGVKMWNSTSFRPYEPCTGAVVALAATCQCPLLVTI